MKTPSYSSLSSAFQRVKANHGCAGVDGVTISAFEARLKQNLQTLEYELSSGAYFPLPLLRILVDKGKGDGEARALCIPSVRDRVAQTAVLNLIEPVLEKEFEDCSFAYRKGRSVRQAVYRIKDCYDKGYRWVVDADIDAFFDNVDQDLLFEKAGRHITNPELLNLIRQWIQAEVWDGYSLKRLEKGIPQGSPISPILANLFLDELDEGMLKADLRFIRYADDFIVLCKRPEEARKALELSKEMLARLDLELDEEDIVSFDRGFKYLGVLFLRSLIMVPFERPKKKGGVIEYPAPFDIQAYRRRFKVIKR